MKLSVFFRGIIAAGFMTVLSVSNVNAEEASPGEPVKYIAITNVNFRKGPSTEDEKICLVKAGISVDVTEYDKEGWSKVTYKDEEGFIKSEYLVMPEEYEKLSKNPPVELIEWSEMKKLFTIGADAKIYDIWSGKTYYVRSFSNGNHADVEPVTKEDTQILKSTYGGEWSWSGRPVWVTINGRTVAGAINGMPHGGGVNGDNGMNGQICLHFKGSTVHNGNKSYARELQSVVDQAWAAANK